LDKSKSKAAGPAARARCLQFCILNRLFEFYFYPGVVRELKIEH
jgi:hypothetical protein